MKTLFKCLACLAVGLYAGAYMGAMSVVYANRIPEVRMAAYGFTEEHCYDDAADDWRGTGLCEIAYMVVGEY